MQFYNFSPTDILGKIIFYYGSDVNIVNIVGCLVASLALPIRRQQHLLLGRKNQKCLQALLNWPKLKTSDWTRLASSGDNGPPDIARATREEELRPPAGS